MYVCYSWDKQAFSWLEVERLNSVDSGWVKRSQFSIFLIHASSMVFLEHPIIIEWNLWISSIEGLWRDGGKGLLKRQSRMTWSHYSIYPKPYLGVPGGLIPL